MSLNPADFFIQKRNSDRVLRRPGTIMGNDLALDTIKNSEIYLFDHSAQITGDFITNSKLIIGPCEGSVFLRDCNDCTVTVACKQLRLRDCKNCTIYLYCYTKSPVIESSENITFYPFNISYAGLTAQLKATGMDPNINYWNSIFDFTADKAENKPHYKIGNENEVELREIILYNDNNDASIGLPDTPFTNIRYNKKVVEEMKNSTAPSPHSTNLASPKLPVVDPASPSNIADLINSIPAADENKSPIHSTKPIEIILPTSGPKSNATSTLPAALEAALEEKKVEIKEFSFSFETTQLEAQKAVDQNEILASLSNYGKEKQEQELQQITNDNNNAKETEISNATNPKSNNNINLSESKQSSSESESKHKPKPDADELWKSILEVEAKPSEKELARKAKEEQHQQELKLQLEKEQKENNNNSTATTNTNSPDSNNSETELDKSFLTYANSSQTMGNDDTVIDDETAEKKLKEIEKQMKKEVKQKLQQATKELEKQAELHKLNQTTTTTTSTNESINNNNNHNNSNPVLMSSKQQQPSQQPAPRNWESVLNLIPESQLTRPGAKQQLASLKMYYMGLQSSSIKNNNNNNNSNSNNNSVNNSNNSESKSNFNTSTVDLNNLTPEQTELAELLKKLDATQYLSDLLNEEVTVEVLHLLELDELTILIPKLGPRKRVEQWIKQRRIALNIPLDSYDRSVTSPNNNNINSAQNSGI